MKIGDATKTTGSTRVEKTKGPARASEADKPAAVAPADEINLLGVPEAELTPLVRKALMSLLTELQELRAELTQARKRLDELEKLADRDALLDILNRRAFARELDRALAMIDRYAMRASLVFIDLNDLKKINDTMGHGAGDAALLHVAGALASNVRQTDAVGRLGGDEFGVLLMQAGKETAEKKAEQLAALVSATPVAWKGKPFTAHVSWGAVEIGPGHSAAQTMERADSAMYAAKRRK